MIQRAEARDVVAWLERLTVVVEEIRDRLGSTATAQSSVEIKTSTRGVDVTTKAYAESPIIDAEQAAIESYVRTIAEVQARLLG